jgi:CheY-like chemotaxis protein/HPt (histidine-containing phosphotransfer) domain-containing protein
VAPTPPILLDGDGARVRQAIASLVRAAIDLAAGGEVAVISRPHETGAGRCAVRIGVTVAAPKQDLAPIAALLDQPPRELAPALQRHGRAGLELALCRELAAMMDGCIGIACVAGQRPEFWLTLELPLARPAAASGAGRCRILVADDNPVNRQIAQRLLEKLGAAADAAADGRQAVEMHVARRYDLILMDCEMPDTDGYQATALLRSLETGGRTPVIALTASTAQDERARCLDAGMDDFLAKPIRAQTLQQILARWLPVTQAPPIHGDSGDELEQVRATFGADFTALARLYRRDAPGRLDALRDAVHSGDLAAAARVAHAFSGSSASIGASGLAGLCRAFELSARNGNATGLLEQASLIADEYARIAIRLHALEQAERSETERR